MTRIVFQQPDGTQQLVDVGSAEDAKAERIAWIRQRAAERIEADWPTYRQLNVLRDGTKAEIAEMKAAINTIRAASNAAQADVGAAGSHDAVYAADLRGLA